MGDPRIAHWLRWIFVALAWIAINTVRVNAAGFVFAVVIAVCVIVAQFSEPRR